MGGAWAFAAAPPGFSFTLCFYASFSPGSASSFLRAANRLPLAVAPIKATVAASLDENGWPVLGFG
ncbi:MAG: hypothetical protein LBL26_00645, partial [Peptococcaceae bacterium]|nr:hypothetical protein [Peptococcaceae bacterium]